MRTKAAFIAGAGSAAIVAIGWSMGASALAAQNAATTTGGTSTSSSSSSNTTDSSSSTTTDSSSASSSSVKDGTYQGNDIDTNRYGSVQVEVVISGGKITAVNTLQNTDADPKSEMIGQQVASMLQSEVISAQSANVSMISGGTYSSTAYLQSLQSALDKAGFTG